MDDWLPCDGRELVISEYPELFAVMGFITWSGGLTFNMPDLRQLGSHIMRVRSDDRYPAGMIIQTWGHHGHSRPLEEAC